MKKVFKYILIIILFAYANITLAETYRYPNTQARLESEKQQKNANVIKPSSMVKSNAPKTVVAPKSPYNAYAPAPKFSNGTGGLGSGSNPSGNPSTTRINATKQPNWGPYMRDLEQRIKKNWSPPKEDRYKRIIVTFTIARDGKLLNHKVTKSSGIPQADSAAMSAVELAAPFDPLPSEFKGNSVPIEFTFDYNVLKGTY